MILKSKLPRNQRDIQDSAKWPRTEQVFDAQKINFDDHEWVQQGQMLLHRCETCLPQAIKLPYGKMLVKKNGHYDLIDEKTWGDSGRGAQKQT